MNTSKNNTSKKTVTAEVDLESRSVRIKGGVPGGVLEERDLAKETLREVESRSAGAYENRSESANIVPGRRSRIMSRCEQRVASGLPALTYNGKHVSLEEARSLPVSILETSDQAKERDITVRSNLSFSEQRDSEKFSLGRVVRKLAEKDTLDGVEREMLDEGQAEARDSNLKGVKGLMFASRAFESLTERRDMTATGGTGGNQGGMTIASNKATLLSTLFDRLFAVQAGATVYDGLVGNLGIPLLVDVADPAHKAENATADEVSPTMTELELKPKRLPVVLEVSNQLLYQSSERALTDTLQTYLRQKLMNVMQAMFINGSGVSNQPKGILNTDGISAVGLGTDGAAPTYAALCELIREVSVDNALDTTSAFAINSKVASKLKQIQKVDSTDSTTLIDDRTPGILAGYKYFESNSIPSDLTKGGGSSLSAIIFGTWADLVIAQWSGMELLVNPYSKDTEGLTRINCAIYYDAGVRRPQSFAAIKDCVTT